MKLKIIQAPRSDLVSLLKNSMTNKALELIENEFEVTAVEKVRMSERASKQSPEYTRVTLTFKVKDQFDYYRDHLSPYVTLMGYLDRVSIQYDKIFDLLLIADKGTEETSFVMGSARVYFEITESPSFPLVMYFYSSLIIADAYIQDFVDKARNKTL